MFRKKTRSSIRNNELRLVPSIVSVRLLPMFCAAALLVGCRVEPAVQAREKTLQRPFQHIDNAPPCTRGTTGNVPVSEKDGSHFVAFNLLNSELIACHIDAVTSAVEPGWTIDTWYDHTDVYGRDQDFKKKLKTGLLFEPLFQSIHRRRLVALEEQSSPPSSRDQRLPASLANQISLMLFNGSAKTEIAKLYTQWPSGPSTIRPLNATPFAAVPAAKAMKLEFVRVDLNKQERTYKVSVVAEKNAALQNESVEMNPALTCPGATRSGTLSEPIPMNCFYYVVVHKLSGDPTGEHRFSYRRDYLLPVTPHPKLDMEHDVVYLLRGFHLIQADQAAWSWSTFWWTPRPRKDSFCGITSPFGTPACQLPWVFYDMDDQRYDAKEEKHETHFNPYIEGRNGGSNCIYCHARALHHSSGKPAGQIDFDRARNYTDGPLLPCFAAEAGMTAASLSPHDVNCADATPTHFLWSLARNLEEHPPPPPALPKAGMATGHP